MGVLHNQPIAHIIRCNLLLELKSSVLLTHGSINTLHVKYGSICVYTVFKAKFKHFFLVNKVK